MFDEETFDAFLAGELNDSLEGPQEALDMVKILNENKEARSNYDSLVFALRALSNVKVKPDGRAFCEAEADMIWSRVWGSVLEDTRTRSGLSKQALRHMATPSLVASISAAIRNLNEQEQATITVDAGSEGEGEFDVSIAKVDGAVSLRLFKNEVDIHCRVDGDAVTATNVETKDIDNWQSISVALRELSRTTGELLNHDALLNGHVSFSNGRATVQLQALPMARDKTK